MARRNIRLLVAAALGIGASGASAGGISGSFTGIVTSSSVYPGGDVNGQLVAGTFGTQFTACRPLPPEANTECFVPQMPVIFSIGARQYSFGAAAYEMPAFGFQNTAAGQTLSLNPDEGDPHGYVALSLSGPADAFVTGSDYNTLHPGPVFASSSTLFIAQRFDLVATIQLTSVQVDGIAAVPEPSTWALLIAGFGATGAAVRVRRRIAA